MPHAVHGAPAVDATWRKRDTSCGVVSPAATARRASESRERIPASAAIRRSRADEPPREISSRISSETLRI